MKKWKWIVLCAVVAIFAVLLIWAISENDALELNTITVQSNRLPQAFDGFRIAHVSDLHSAEMGQGNEKLLSILRDAKPDIIAITGDLLDCRDADSSVALAFCKAAVEIAPVYYVTGNHEVRLETEFFNRVMAELRQADVTVMEDEEDILMRGDAAISIAGHQWGDTDEIGQISQFDGFTVLLSHPPEDIDAYASAEFDLVLSGHAHGGQFRLPFIGGLIAPGQGIFPQYDAGLYRVQDTQMVVSRGIGNSTFPLRFNNRPEVILIILEA